MEVSLEFPGPATVITAFRCARTPFRRPKPPKSISAIPDFPFSVHRRISATGWMGAGIPANAVIVHVYTAGANPYSFLFDTSAFNGSIPAGQTLKLGNFRIQVNSTGGPAGPPASR